jgi:hypothetical protein
MAMLNNQRVYTSTMDPSWVESHTFTNRSCLIQGSSPPGVAVASMPTVGAAVNLRCTKDPCKYPLVN